MRALIMLLLLAWSASAHGALPGWDPHPGAPLPLDARFVDQAGRQVELARYFGGGPVVLVLGYFECPNLCGTAMRDLLTVASSLGPAQYRLLAVSIDPAEGPVQAARAVARYRAQGASPVPLDLLTGSPPAIARLAGAAGFRYKLDPQRGYLHPAGFVVATSDGTISSYLTGLPVSAPALRQALAQASEGRVATLAGRIALVCSHFDPATGIASGPALALVRSAEIAVLAVLATALLRLHRRARSKR